MDYSRFKPITLLAICFMSFAVFSCATSAEPSQALRASATVQDMILVPTITQAPTTTPPLAARTNTPNPTPSPDLESSSTATMTASTDGMVMLYVPEGILRTYARLANGRKAGLVEVYLDAFWIDRTEITNAMFAAFLNKQGNQQEGESLWFDAQDEDAQIEMVDGQWRAVHKPNHPVVEITWYGARAYCEWAGRRLPSYAEWQKAARGTDERQYPWGNSPPNCSYANYSVLEEPTECRGQSSEVGSYLKGMSPYGALDMVGNASEWVADWFSEDYIMPLTPEKPNNPSSGTIRAFLGGSWNYGPSNLAIFNDRYAGPSNSNRDLGFRCARDG